MSIAHCHAKHKCADGSEGECYSLKGHYGTHLCAACLSAFTNEAPESRETDEAPPPGERAYPRGGARSPNLQAPHRDAQPGQFQLAGVWESQLQTGYGVLNTQLILEPTKKFSQQAVLGSLLTYDVGTYQVGDGFIHFVVQDHEPKKYHGEEMHWLTSWTYFYTVVDADTMTFEDRIVGSSWTVRRRVE